MELISGATTLPGKCFLCERAFEDTEPGANMGIVFTPDWPHTLWGQKMVCAICAKAVAQTHGFVTQTVDEFTQQQDVIFAELDKTRAERDALQAKVDEGVAGVIKLIEAQKPKPRAAKTA